MVKTYRDIQLIEKDKETWLAIACDVSASIGPKSGDLVKVNNETAGYYAAAVTLMELLSIGAKPISVVDTLGVEMNPSGREIIDGVRQAMAEAGIDGACLTGSTEDNIPTSSTSIGVTVVSELSKVRIEHQKPKQGQSVYLVGVPKMGQQFVEEEIIAGKGEVADINLVKALREMDWVGHMLPVGSKGIRYEMTVLCEMNDMILRWETDIPLELDTSAGPATCLLICCDNKYEPILRKVAGRPVTYLGLLDQGDI